MALILEFREDIVLSSAHVSRRPKQWAIGVSIALSHSSKSCDTFIWQQREFALGSMQPYPFLWRQFLVTLRDQLAILFPMFTPTTTCSPFLLPWSTSLAAARTAGATSPLFLNRARLLRMRGDVTDRLSAEALSRQPVVAVDWRHVDVSGAAWRTRRLLVEAACRREGRRVVCEWWRGHWWRGAWPVAGRTPRRVVDRRRLVVEGVQLTALLRRFFHCSRAASLVHVARPSEEHQT